MDFFEQLKRNHWNAANKISPPTDKKFIIEINGNSFEANGFRYDEKDGIFYGYIKKVSKDNKISEYELIRFENWKRKDR